MLEAINGYLEQLLLCVCEHQADHQSGVVSKWMGMLHVYCLLENELSVETEIDTFLCEHIH